MLKKKKRGIDINGRAHTRYRETRLINLTPADPAG